MTDLRGWVAPALMLAAFACGRAARLRVSALAANTAVVAGDASTGLWPVLAQHATLAPVKLWRLRQALHEQRGAQPARAAHTSAAPGREFALIEPTSRR
jgi:hypothetical protein